MVPTAYFPNPKREREKGPPSPWGFWICRSGAARKMWTDGGSSFREQLPVQDAPQDQLASACPMHSLGCLRTVQGVPCGTDTQLAWLKE